jgi:integrase
MASKPRLLEQVRERMRVGHYSLRTEHSYINWIRRFILFHQKRHPRAMGAPEIEAFLTHLAVARNVAASTQNQALNAILFLYREVLEQELPWLQEVQRAKKPVRLPVVLTDHEARQLLARLEGTHWLMASLLYGAGLRLMKCMRLRVKDIEFNILAPIRIRHPNGAGTLRAQGCEHHDGLYARPQSRWEGGSEPLRYEVGGGSCV